MYTDDPVEIYRSEARKVPKMNREQELECLRHIRARDEQADVATKDLVEANLALVISIADRHPSVRIHILDLIMAGNDALMAAVQPFADSGAEGFSAYATPFIDRALEHAVATSQPPPIPAHKR
jgi:RNA polymerase primary sigma factor